MALAEAEPPVAAVRDDDAIHVDVDGQSLEFGLAEPPTVEWAVAHAAGGTEGASVLTAPMPGRVIAIRTSQGKAVRAGEPVVVIEAMKMEHAVVAPADGTVERVTVREGQQVERGAVVAELTAGDPHTERQ